MSEKRNELKEVSARFVCDGTEVDHGNCHVLLHAALDGEGWEEFTAVTPSGEIQINIDVDVPAAKFFEPGEVYEVLFRQAKRKDG